MYFPKKRQKYKFFGNIVSFFAIVSGRGRNDINRVEPP